VEEGRQGGKQRGQVRITQGEQSGRIGELADQVLAFPALTDFLGSAFTFGLGEAAPLLHHFGFGLRFLVG
jgi:hypothetical protein